MLIEPTWVNRPTMPGIYWCGGKGDASSVFDIVRIAYNKDGKLYVLFPGKDLMYDIEDLLNVVARWYGPVLLADIGSCLVMSNGLYKEGENPQEPIQNVPKSRKKSQKHGKKRA